MCFMPHNIGVMLFMPHFSMFLIRHVSFVDFHHTSKFPTYKIMQCSTTIYVYVHIQHETRFGLSAVFKFLHFKSQRSINWMIQLPPYIANHVKALNTYVCVMCLYS